MRNSLLSLACLALAGPAAPAAAKSAESWGALYPAVYLTSDYRFDGVSSSDGRPVPQGSLYWWRPDKTYAGVWVSGVDYRDGGTSYEVDVYAGRNFDVGRTRLTAEVMASVFPDQAAPGPTYDFVQAKLKVRRRIGRADVLASAAWTPDASYTAGQAWRLEGEATYPLTSRVAAIGAIGRRLAQRGRDRWFWRLGAAATWRDMTFDVRYVGQSQSPASCFNARACRPAVVATVSANLPAILIGARR